jgi:hypothetical protein
MKRLRLLALPALLISIQLVSAACHLVTKAGPTYVVYFNENDSAQFIGLQAAEQPLRQWWHGDPLEPNALGEYIQNDGKKTVVGAYWTDVNTYVLKLDSAGKETRFSIQADSSLRDESGHVWRRGNGTVIAERKLQAWDSQK